MKPQKTKSKNGKKKKRRKSKKNPNRKLLAHRRIAIYLSILHIIADLFLIPLIFSPPVSYLIVNALFSLIINTMTLLKIPFQFSPAIVSTGLFRIVTVVIFVIVAKSVLPILIAFSVFFDLIVIFSLMFLKLMYHYTEGYLISEDELL